jgi:hypothetical protein
MNTNLYWRWARLFTIALAFAACQGHNTTSTNSTADSVVVPPADNTHTFDPPPGDSLAMLKDSLYNADSTHRKKK